MAKSALKIIWIVIWFFSNISFTALPTEWHQYSTGDQGLPQIMLFQYGQDSPVTNGRAGLLEIGQLVPGVLNMSTYEGKQNWKKSGKMHKKYQLGHIT